MITRWNKLKENLVKNKVLMTFIWAVCMNLVIECLSRKSIIRGVVHMCTAPFVFVFNALIVALTISVCHLFQKKRFVLWLVTIIWLLIGIINCILLSFRKTPFTGNDFLLISDAIKIMNAYITTWGIALICVGIVVVIAGLVYLAVKSPVITEKINYFRTIGTIGILWMLITAMLWIGLVTGTIAERFGNITTAYKEYGFVYCFVNSIIDNGIKRPANYNNEDFQKINEIVETGSNVTEQTPVNTKKEMPNIIFLQLESFMNPYLIKDLKLSENPVPNFLKLYDSYPSGYLMVPSFGAGTANTEFEVITGMNLNDFGTGEYPYKTVLKNDACESMAYDVKSYGYKTHMLHNNDGTFYNRYHVAANLGFDTFSSIEYMGEHQTNPIGWANDEMLVDEILKTLDSTKEKDYIYTISVQGHGDYPASEEELEEITKDHPLEYNIDIEGPIEEEDLPGMRYYLSQVKEMDAFVGKLIRQLEKRDEKTILILYGDHLPGFAITDEMLTSEDIYKSQYVIWSNGRYDYKDCDLEAFQLSSYIMKKLGMTEGVINRYHQNFQDAEDYLETLTMLEYDILYGDRKVYENQELYLPTEIQLGIDEIHTYKAYNFNDRICVEGANFNNYSFIVLNGKEVETICVNPHTLTSSNLELHDGDVITVVQHGEDGIVLSMTEEFIYHPE